MGSCGTAVTILLTRLLSHGLATHNWPTMKVILFCCALLIPCFGITSLKLAREITPSPAKIIIALVSFGLRIIQLLFILFFILHSLSFKCTSMKSGVLLWDRDLQNFGPKAKNRRLFLLAPVCVPVSSDNAGVEFLDLRPCCLHIFAAVAANIWNTVSWQHSQDCV